MRDRVAPEEPEHLIQVLMGQAESRIKDLWTHLLDLAPTIGEQFLVGSEEAGRPDDLRGEQGRRLGIALLGFFARVVLSRLATPDEPKGDSHPSLKVLDETE